MLKLSEVKIAVIGLGYVGLPLTLEFAKKRKVVWKNGGTKVSFKRSDLKDPYLIAKKIQDAGFYDGDLMDLPGIDYKTGQLKEDENILIKGFEHIY